MFKKALLLTFDVMATNAFAIITGILVFLAPPIAKLYKEGWATGWPDVKASLLGDAGLGITAALAIWAIVFIFNLGRAKELGATHDAHPSGSPTQRRLSKMQQAAMVRRLEPLVQTIKSREKRYVAVGVQWHPNSPDAKPFAYDVIAAITQAGLPVNQRRMREMCLDDIKKFPAGVWVLKNQHWGDDPPIAATIKVVLDEMKIESVLGFADYSDVDIEVIVSA